jgi:hypothetical protein
MRKTAVTLGLAFVFLAALGMDVRAQVTFPNPGPDLQNFLTQTGLTQDQLGTKLQELFTSGAGGFLKNLGDAQSFTSKGLGVDYASEATYFEVGGSASFALGVDKSYQPGNNPANTQAFPLQGAGLNASVMAGLSLGFLKLPVMVFGNWMQLPTQRYRSEERFSRNAETGLVCRLLLVATQFYCIDLKLSLIAIGLSTNWFNFTYSN